MKKANIQPSHINSISELHRLLNLPKPEHTLVSMIQLADLAMACRSMVGSYVFNFYSICIKKDFKGKMKYGQRYYDFDEGVMTFFSPGQIIATDVDDDVSLNGMWLVVHPDFLRNYPLAKSIKQYGYFSYAVHEALHLSEKEEQILGAIFNNIEQEYRASIDAYSQDVIISHIEVLLNYSNRFYNRQFITRKHVGTDLLIDVESLLGEYFRSGEVQQHGLPTVQYLSDKLNISSNYLSDQLRTLTGQNAQQHIHRMLIEKAKETLTTTSLSVSEIAYELGFEYPQSFSKLFKSKTNVSPLEFRHAFN